MAKAPPKPEISTSMPSSSSASSSAPERPITDVLAGASARACSQATIHPIDTMKVRMQAGNRVQPSKGPAASSSAGSGRNFRVHAAGIETKGLGHTLQSAVMELGSLYKGVVGAACGAGIIIGTYFAFYSTSKRYLRENTNMSDGTLAFTSGAIAAVGSSVVKVPIAVCIRSVQAGVYKNAFHAARSITQAAGTRGLFTGWLPTLLEDAPDMAVKFAVYESMRALHVKLHNGDSPSTLEDLLMGGCAGAAAAAATTPLDVVKTRMMCSASTRPTITQAAASVLAEGGGWKAFFRGVGPRALSNGLNSAVFFCFFEAIRRVLLVRQQEAVVQRAVSLQLAKEAAERSAGSSASGNGASGSGTAPAASLTLGGALHAAAVGLPGAAARGIQRPGMQRQAHAGGRLACLSLAVPLAYSSGGAASR